MTKSSSKTARKQPPGLPFVKGDPRINRKGRPPIPKTQQELNAMLDRIFAEKVKDKQGEEMEKLEVMLNRLILHKNPTGPIHILDRRFGKIPQAVDVTSGGEKLSDLSDDQKIQRIFALIEKANRAKSK